MKRIFKALLTCCLGASVLFTPACALEAGEPLRVGLYYGTGALPAPQLQNAEGSGYEAGYYDSAKVFYSLYPISETKVVMLKDENYARASDGTYAETSDTPVIGAYHVQLAQTYGSAAEAQKAAQAVDGFAAYVNGAYVVRTGSYPTLAAAQMAAAPVGGTAAGGSKTGITVAATENGAILFEYDGDALFAMAPQGTKPVTWCKGFRYYGNFSYPRKQGGNLSVINYVALDDYVKGVVPYEMSPEWNIEALKAQAVCARSEAMTETKHEKDGFDVCNTTNCQVYRGLNQATDNSDRAVDQTAGIYAAVDGKPVGLFYFSSDGGATEDAVNVWGGEYSYLQGKEDPYEAAAVPEKKAVWSVTMTADEVTRKIRAADSAFGTLQSLAVTKNSAVGNVIEVTATDTAGKKTVITKGNCRSVFGLNSQRYTITAGGAVSGGNTSSKGGGAADTVKPATIGGGILSGFKKAMDGAAGAAPAPSAPSPGTAVSGDRYTFQGTGWGHHVGMSQYGAKAMAEQGKTYEDILNFYFTGITLQK